MNRSRHVSARRLAAALLAAAWAGGAAAQEHAPGKVRAPPAYLTGEEVRAARIYREVLPTVVTVFTTRQVVSEEEEGGEEAIGSGVVISPECHVLTAAHVVERAERIVVKSADGRRRPAELVFSEASADIALIRFAEPERGAAYARLGDSDRLAVGQAVYAIGSPYGLENSFSVGHISGFREFDRLYDGTIPAEFIQTDAAINIGNSGSPLFNSVGEVVGIASRIVTTSGGSQGVGFVVAINTAKQLLALEDRVWMGIEAVYLTGEMASRLMGRSLEGGLLVVRVVKGSPADKAGLRGGSVPARVMGRDFLLGGDLILEFAAQEVCHSDCLVQVKKHLMGLDQIPIKYLRGGDVREAVIDVTTSRRNYLLGR